MSVFIDAKARVLACVHDSVRILPIVCAAMLTLLLTACGAAPNSQEANQSSDAAATGTSADGAESGAAADGGNDSATSEATSGDDSQQAPARTLDTANMTPAEIRATLNITEDFRDVLIHGEKPAEFQKYIVMHDTEGEGDAASVVDWWASNGSLVASHFVVNKDGSIVQCVPLDKIAHHAGFGDAGHNEEFGVTDESRDDKKGTTPIGDWAPDYGMNSYSVGIEMVHVGESHQGYPEEQLRAVDGLIAYIDAYYGFQSAIIEHSDWRTGNSDCSEEFQPYLQNLQKTRTHDGS